LTADPEWKDEIGAFRRKAQRAGAKRLVFVDQSAVYMGALPLRSIVPRGSSALVMSSSPTLFPPRFDIMGAVSYDSVLPVQVMSPEQRRSLGVKGWRKQMVLDWLRESLAPALCELREHDMVLVMDKALRIQPDEALAAVRAGGCHRVTRAWRIPTAAAKHISPLDNSLWHEYKERVRAREPDTAAAMVRALHDEWRKQSAANIHHYYRHCGLTRHSDEDAGLL
jgi:hypothetical protein